MSIKKRGLLSLAAMAIALAAFASSAMAGGGVLKDNGTVVANGTKVNFKGAAKFETLGTGIECHVTAQVEAVGSTGETGHVTQFEPVTSTCHGFGSIYNGCKVTTDSTENLPYHVTATSGDFDVTGEIAISSTLSSCVNTKITFTNLSFEAATLKPLATGSVPSTNTNGHLGTTATSGQKIAGVEIVETEGEAVNNIGTLGVEATGKLEATGSDLCTYDLT